MQYCQTRFIYNTIYIYNAHNVYNIHNINSICNVYAYVIWTKSEFDLCVCVGVCVWGGGTRGAIYPHIVIRHLHHPTDQYWALRTAPSLPIVNLPNNKVAVFFFSRKTILLTCLAWRQSILIQRFIAPILLRGNQSWSGCAYCCTIVINCDLVVQMCIFVHNRTIKYPADNNITNWQRRKISWYIWIASNHFANIKRCLAMRGSEL